MADKNNSRITQNSRHPTLTEIVNIIEELFGAQRKSLISGIRKFLRNPNIDKRIICIDKAPLVLRYFNDIVALYDKVPDLDKDAFNKELLECLGNY